MTTGAAVWAALIVVYIVWGSTYLAIRVIVEDAPALLAASLRFLTAGAAIFIFLAARGGLERLAMATREAFSTILVGGLLLLGGNGIVSVAEKDVPSGLAALVIATVPLWVLVLRFLTGDRIHRATLIGVLIGFAGVAILVGPGDRPDDAPVWAILLVVLAAGSWATGSFLSYRLPMPRDPYLSTGAQMLAGGTLLAIAAVASGELSELNSDSFTDEAVAALIYLILFGSLVAFTAYVWLLRNAPISLVATYAFVNPVVAIFLGWLILSEEITPTTVIGAVVIVGSVAFTLRREAAASEPLDADEAVALGEPVA
jgi:drug/metabolite transporter (DMT)-like permease